MSRDIVKIWMVKFDKPPVICQGFPPPKLGAIWYSYTDPAFLVHDNTVPSPESIEAINCM